MTAAAASTRALALAADSIAPASRIVLLAAVQAEGAAAAGDLAGALAKFGVVADALAEVEEILAAAERIAGKGGAP